MDAVFEAGRAKGWPEEALSREYFTVPEPPDYVNLPFALELKKSGRTIEVPEDKSAVDALAEIGIHITTKCSDGICGVCACGYSEGEVEHRDYVLSAAERKSKIVLCCSRAAQEGGTIKLDL